MSVKLKQLYNDVKNHSDLTYRSIPYFISIVREIKVELLKISTEQGEQITRDVSDAVRLINITEREDLSNIQSYPKEIPKYLTRLQVNIVSCLGFVSKKNYSN
jgi:hypothetical protein